jgi:hypothetical protein
MMQSYHLMMVAAGSGQGRIDAHRVDQLFGKTSWHVQRPNIGRPQRHEHSNRSWAESLFALSGKPVDRSAPDSGVLYWFGFLATDNWEFIFGLGNVSYYERRAIIRWASQAPRKGAVRTFMRLRRGLAGRSASDFEMVCIQNHNDAVDFHEMLLQLPIRNVGIELADNRLLSEQRLGPDAQRILRGWKGTVRRSDIREKDNPLLTIQDIPKDDESILRLFY